MVLPWNPISVTGSDMGVPPWDTDTYETNSLRYPRNKSTARHRLRANHIDF